MKFQPVSPKVTAIPVPHNVPLVDENSAKSIIIGRFVNFEVTKDVLRGTHMCHVLCNLVSLRTWYIFFLSMWPTYESYSTHHAWLKYLRIEVMLKGFYRFVDALELYSCFKSSTRTPKYEASSYIIRCSTLLSKQMSCAIENTTNILSFWICKLLSCAEHVQWGSSTSSASNGYMVPLSPYESVVTHQLGLSNSIIGINLQFF